jgi:hypothetical protein
VTFSTSSVRSILLLALPSALAAQTSYPARCGTGIPSTETGYVPLPRGDVFCPLVADPKAPHSFASYLRERAGAMPADSAIDIASIGIGDAFGLGRWSGSRQGDGVQLSLSAGVFAQFDLGTPSYDLLNADRLHHRPSSHSSKERLFGEAARLSPELAPGRRIPSSRTSGAPRS